MHNQKQAFGRQVFGTNKPMNCTACGTTGVKPRKMVTEDNMFIYEESKYVCPRCGNYFHKGAVSKTPKNPEAPE